MNTLESRQICLNYYTNLREGMNNSYLTAFHIFTQVYYFVEHIVM